MAKSVIPKTLLGKLSLVLITLMPVLFFVGASFTNSLYSSVPAGNSISEDIAARPALAITMLAGTLSGVTAFIVGLLSIIRKKERSTLVYIATVLGAMLLIVLFGELLAPH